MNTTQLSCFLSVADFLNFSRAAKQLRMTQPAVSHQINSLEDELGVKLFARTSKYVRLTQEGYLFRQYAQQILSLTMISQKRLQESRHTYVIRFGIGCHSSLELQFLKPVLQALHREFPSLHPAPSGNKPPNGLPTGSWRSGKPSVFVRRTILSLPVLPCLLPASDREAALPSSRPTAAPWPSRRSRISSLPAAARTSSASATT